MRILNYMKGLVFVLILASCQSPNTGSVDLSGKWTFQTDPHDVGIKEQWFQRQLTDTVSLPGSMKDNLKGDIPDLKTQWTGSIYDSSFYFNKALEKFRTGNKIYFPFWLTPCRYYKGAAWYQREITIPKSWKESVIECSFERVHWQTELWLDGKRIGSDNSLSTPHSYNLTSFATPGTHLLTVRIDNRMDSVNVGENANSVSDHTQGNWNGMIGKLVLSKYSKVHLGNIQIYPDPDKKEIQISLQIKRQNSSNEAATLQLKVNSAEQTTDKVYPEVTLNVNPNDTIVQINYPMPDFKTWSEFSPFCYQLQAKLNSKSGIDTKETIFGMRKIVCKDGHLLLNGKNIFVRGTVNDCVFPKTGYPPMDKASWIRLFNIYKDCGLNSVRFHSWCPPETAFEVADSMGFYLQPEAPLWANHSTSLGSGRPVDKYLFKETQRILATYGNHPSFVFYSFGNEPRGNYVPLLDQYIDHFSQIDRRRVYTASAIGMHWKVNPKSQYIVRSAPRGLPFRYHVPGSDFNYSDKIKDEKRPYITHEMGQWCAFPDFSEIKKYTGTYEARNFELFQKQMDENGLGKEAHNFLMASGKLQALCYKAEIEAALRTPELDGFFLLGVNDFSGQGTALVGMLNAFKEEKGYITKKEIHQFCSPVVPLVNLDRYTFYNTEKIHANFLLANYSAGTIKAQPEYQLKSKKGKLIFKGKLPEENWKAGQCDSLGSVEIPLNSITKATHCILSLKVNNTENEWDVWVYPAKLRPLKTNKQVKISHHWDKATQEFVKNGGKVLLDLSGQIKHGAGIAAWFTPVFWNTSWFRMRPPHTLGLFVAKEHPVFKDFPTSYHTNFQWWDLVHRQQVMLIDQFPKSLQPMVEPIDTWFLNRRLAQLFEVKLGKGKLIVTTLHLTDNSKEPSSRQLLHSILDYMNSDQFNPRVSVRASLITKLLTDSSNGLPEFETSNGLPNYLQGPKE